MIAVALVVATVSADPPNETVAPLWNPVPEMLTDVPPTLAPLLGVTDVTVGAATYVKQIEQVPLCASGFVTTTLTNPAAPAAVVPVMVVALIVKTVSADPPNDTVAPVWKPLPAIVTAVPPRVEPLVGVIELTVGAATYVKQAVHVPVCASGFVTVTLTAPAARAVVVPVMLVPVTLETVTGEPPSEAVAPVWNPVPVMVTDVPPTAGPLVGAIELTVGAGARYMKQPVHVPLCVSVLVTTTFTDPAACAVVVPVMVVFAIVNAVRAEPPSETVAPVPNPVPVTVTDVPPAIAPVFGVTDATVGAATYVKQPVHVPLCVSEFVTVTFTDPAAWLVVVPVIVVALIVATVSDEPLRDTVAPLRNPVPATVTEVPPALGPPFGVTEVTVGAAT